MNKKGFQLTINMLVVIILSIAILSAGVSIFYKGFNQAASLKEQVDTQTQQQLDDLMTNSDALLAIPFTTKEADRGDYVDFNMGIHNELGVETKFYVCVSFSGTSADYGTIENYYDKPIDEWLLMADSVKELDIGNNERGYVPIRFRTHKKMLKGQYVFNVVVKYLGEGASAVIDYDMVCDNDFNYIIPYATTQKLYVTIK